MRFTPRTVTPLELLAVLTSRSLVRLREDLMVSFRRLQGAALQSVSRQGNVLVQLLFWLKGCPRDSNWERPPRLRVLVFLRLEIEPRKQLRLEGMPKNTGSIVSSVLRLQTRWRAEKKSRLCSEVKRLGIRLLDW